MNVIWRFLLTYVLARFRSPIGIFDTCITSFSTLPTDIDFLFHMNNGRYFSLMDVARLDFLIRSGILEKFVKGKIYPVIASEMIRFKKSLNLFTRFKIETTIICWDEKFFYVKQIFKRSEDIYALGVIKFCYLSKETKTIVPTSEVAKIFEVHTPSPAMPHWLMEWKNADQGFFQETVKTQ